MKVLIVDHLDSFTHNLYQQIGALLGEAPHVVRSNTITFEGIVALRPERVVLSPGPGHPAVPRDFGVSAELLARLDPRVPVLGVCLGHQGIAHQLGGRVVRAPSIRHGKTESIRVDPESRLFQGLPERVEVMRYHSLVAERESLPPALRITAETEPDGLVMAFEHRERPLFGVQFHPESVGTPLGDAMIRNFLAVPA
jgi:anthranilate synthase component 2